MKILLTGTADVEPVELQEIASYLTRPVYVLPKEFPSMYDPETFGPVTRRTINSRVNRAEILEVLQRHSDIVIVAQGYNLHTIAWAFDINLITFRSDVLIEEYKQKYVGYPVTIRSIKTTTDNVVKTLCNYA